MNVRARRWLVTLMLCFSLLSSVATAWAAEPSVNDMWSKLGRGIGNVTFGWLEIFNQPVLLGKEKRWPIAVFGGVPKGIFYAVGRTVVGVFEVLTFPVEVPEGYATIMKPDFIVPD